MSHRAQMWAIIDGMEWSKDFDEERCRSIFCALSEEAQNQLNEFVGARTSTLRDVIRKWELATGQFLHIVYDGEKIPVGDDAENDLIAHVVGLGSKEYERHLAQPHLMAALVLQDKVVESFLYCLQTNEEQADFIKETS